MVGDETEPDADSLRLQSASFSDNFHLSIVLFFVEHEDEHPSLVL